MDRKTQALLFSASLVSTVAGHLYVSETVGARMAQISTSGAHLRIDGASGMPVAVVSTSDDHPITDSTNEKAAPRGFIPRTGLAKRLYAIRQREIAAGRLVPRHPQEILDELEAERTRT